MAQKRAVRPFRSIQCRILGRTLVHRTFLLALQAGSSGTYTQGDITLPRVDAIAAKDRAGESWLAITNADPNQSAEIEVTLAGINAKSAAGETLTASKVDSVNTFDAPNSVVPKPFSAKAQDDKLTLKLAPKSVTVVAVEQ